MKKKKVDLSKNSFLVSGGSGFLGSYVVAELAREGIPKKNIKIPRSATCDLRTWDCCRKAVRGIDIVIHLAAKVGGIGLNREKPGELFYDNLLMGALLMEAARQEGVKKFVGVGTICSYPKFTNVPFKEKNLWNGYPEETNAPYGLAKKMLLVQAQSYRTQYGFNAIFLLPVNLYGPGDDVDPKTSHVIPALIKKLTEAVDRGMPRVTLWGSGKVTREFLYVADAARAIVRASYHYNKAEPVNIGSGREISIKDLAQTIADKVGFKGTIRWDRLKPDGQPRRHLDVSRAWREFDFKATTTFDKGLEETIRWYRSLPKK